MMIAAIHVTPGIETWPIEIEWASRVRTRLVFTRKDRVSQRVVLPRHLRPPWRSR
jgi:hypothetical protein